MNSSLGIRGPALPSVVFFYDFPFQLTARQHLMIGTVVNNVERIAATLVMVAAFASSGRGGSSNSLMDISADGRFLACSNRDNGSVTIVELPTLRKVGEILVGPKPEGVTFLGDSNRLAVAVYGMDRVVYLDADQRQIVGQTEVFDEPYGVVSDSTGQRVYVTLDYPGHVLEIEAASYGITRDLDVGDFIRGIAWSPEGNGGRLFVTEYYRGAVKAIDVASWQVVDEWTAASTDNLLRQIALNPRRPKAYLPHVRSRVTTPHGEGSIFPFISILDTTAGEGPRRRRKPMDAFLGNLVTAGPWEIAVSADGKQLYVIFGATNDMFACELIDDDYREIRYRKYVQLGANPRAVRVAPDGKTVYVYNALDFQVVAYDTQTLELVGKVKVTENPLDAKVLEGKRLFYSALQPIVGRRWISCAGCHPDGEPDGRTWHNPEGLRNTQSLAGLGWTHPVHWSADRDEVQDFEHTIRGPLMQGRGLIDGPVHPELGPPNKGLSGQLDALAAYTNSHKFSRSPHAKDGLSASAQRGKEIFFSETTGCASCHSGPFYTDSHPRPPDRITRHDVGTGADDPGEKLGPAYDTPTLLGVYRTAPYLHHGKADSLEAVLTTFNHGDKHGVTSHLASTEISDLVEFLKALPYEDPEPEARRLGLTQVEE
jgi:DNA-binding beta-propeller fold protein YncE